MCIFLLDLFLASDFQGHAMLHSNSLKQLDHTA